MLTLPLTPRLLAVLLATPLLLAACGAHTGVQPRDRDLAAGQSEATRLVQKGRAAIASGDTVRAEQYLTLAIARGADEGAVMKDVLAACIAGSRLRGALDHALPYLQRHPEDDELRYLVASLHDSLGQHGEARAQLERLLNHDPDHADALFLAGVLASPTAPDVARQHFGRYLSLEPQGRHAAEVRGRLADLQMVPLELLAERGPRNARPTYEAVEQSPSRTWVGVRHPRGGTHSGDGKPDSGGGQ